MITTKAYLVREINKLKKKRKHLKAELATLRTDSNVKSMFKNASIIIEKEIAILNITITAYSWVANTNQNSLPKLKKKKRKVKKVKQQNNDPKTAPEKLSIT